MKKLIIILAMCIATNVLAQNSFPTENAIWNERIKGNYRIFGLLGDTTFNGITYSKLYLLADTIIPEESGGLWCVGGFRNEGQKVFFKPVNWEYPDILFYDFGAEVGDTIWHNAWMPLPSYGYQYYYQEFEPHSNCYSIVYHITETNGQKIYDVYSSVPGLDWDNRWYEGIGSEKGILFSLPASYLMYWDPNEDFQLNCFKHNDIVKFLNNPKCNKCFCPFVNIKEETKNTENIKIYPNPTNSQLTIKNERLGIVALEVKILDLTGKIVFKEKVMNNANIDVSYLQAGIYFLEINNQTTKIIIK
jgi:hypothetical protein